MTVSSAPKVTPPTAQPPPRPAPPQPAQQGVPNTLPSISPKEKTTEMKVESRGKKQEKEDMEQRFWLAVQKGPDHMQEFLNHNHVYVNKLVEQQEKDLARYSNKQTPAPTLSSNITEDKKEISTKEGNDMYILIQVLKKLSEVTRRLEVLEAAVPTQPIPGENAILARLLSKVEDLERKAAFPRIGVRAGAAAPSEEKKERDRDQRLDKIENTVTEFANRKTACDTTFRQKLKRVIEKYFVATGLRRTGSSCKM